MNEKELKKQLKKVADYSSSKADGVDEEFSRELADQDDLEAQARANAADERQKKQN
ncbi:YfhD family protein [Priestia megaterium]|uniref:YfhD family protein n=1 Tax=Priestia megaterium TaxID=1404 RepID=UPI00234F31E8|nr:YfhD family protein [Priestia megaterium]MDC7771058.1 YfhD family protein [Priestia megaterium]